MSLSDDVSDLKDRVRRVEGLGDPPVPVKKKAGLKEFRVPSGLVRWARKGPDRFVALKVSSSQNGFFERLTYRDGLLYDESGKEYRYDADALVWLPKQKVSLVVLFEWRLVPYGGTVEKVVEQMADLPAKERESLELGLANYGQQTIIRALEQKEVDLSPKKGFGMSPIMWLFLGVGVIYVLSRVFG